MTDKKQSKSNIGEFSKIPPQDIALEEVILGGILLEKEAMEEICDIITHESFYKDEHQKIFNACSFLFSQNKPIDILTVMDQLIKTNEIELVGGPAYLSQLTQKVASAAHIEFHAKLIQQKFIQREFIRLSTEILNKAYDESIDVNDLIEYSQTEIGKVATGSFKKMGIHLWEVGKKRLKELENLFKNEVKFTGVKCWDKVNSFTGGWQNGNMILLAARPSDGKTRIAQEIAKIASINGTPCAFFSLEMAENEIYDRELSCQTGIENMYIRQADFKENDWNKIDQAQKFMEGLDFIIDDTPAMTVNEFKSKARYYKKKYGVGLIIIDYLQLMKSPIYSKFREQEVSHISGTIKSVAKELNIPIIALSQLSRDIDKRPDKRPKLSDLRESGSLEQDADCIIFIHRPEKYDNDATPPNEADSHKNLIELHFAKYRNGSIGTVKLWKSDKWSKIYEYKNDNKEKIEDIF